LTKDKVLAEQMIQSEVGYSWVAVSRIFVGEVPMVTGELLFTVIRMGFSVKWQDIMEG